MTFSESVRAEFLQKKLERNQVRLQELLEPGYDAVVVHSNSTIIALNQAAAELFHYHVDELLGANAWTLFPPKSATKLAENILKQSKEPYQVTAFYKNGSEFEVIIKGVDFKLEDEPVRAVLLKKAD